MVRMEGDSGGEGNGKRENQTRQLSSRKKERTKKRERKG